MLIDTTPGIGSLEFAAEYFAASCRHELPPPSSLSFRQAKVTLELELSRSISRCLADRR
jgi:hypothetical protein